MKKFMFLASLMLVASSNTLATNEIVIDNDLQKDTVLWSVGGKTGFSSYYWLKDKVTDVDDFNIGISFSGFANAGTSLKNGQGCQIGVLVSVDGKDNFLRLEVYGSSNRNNRVDKYFLGWGSESISLDAGENNGLWDLNLSVKKTVKEDGNEYNIVPSAYYASKLVPANKSEISLTSVTLKGKLITDIHVRDVSCYNSQSKFPHNVRVGQKIDKIIY